MAPAPGSGRRATKAAAERRAAKERRERFLVIGLGVVLVIVLAFELPRLLGGGSSSSTATTSTSSVTTQTTTPAASGAANAKKLKRALLQAPRDVFAVAAQNGTENTLGNVPNPPGLRDPFAPSNTPESSVAPPPAKPVTASPLPGTIVIGKPGSGRVAVKGWIVILASIPTAQGAGPASSFAAQARQRSIGAVSVLNSSNRRPLRGGYWVVYTGPYDTLNQVATAAGKVHNAGFATAYIRELIVYRAKKKK